MTDSAADLVLHNAQVYTVDEEAPTASAVAIRNGQIVAVGPDDEIVPNFPEGPRVDAARRTVIPGFIDAHAHLQELGLSLRRADLNHTSSPSEVVDRLTSFVAERDLPDNGWLRGHGWDETDWPDSASPSRALLDAAFPERPVWLTRTDVHAGWANTAALEETMGLDRLRSASDPEAGRIRRDDTGAPTGVLVDDAMAFVEDRIPPPGETEQERALSTALQHTARHGITGLHDAGIGLDTIRRLRRRIEDGHFPLWVYAMIDGRGEAFDYFCERGPLHHPSGKLDVRSVKFFADGALGSRGAALLDDYADDVGNRGFLLHDEQTLRRNVQAAVRCGFQVNTHAIGDRANRVVLDAYETAEAECTAPLLRPRIEHAQIVAPVDRSRFGALDVIASVQPQFAPSDKGWAPTRLGPNRLDRAYAWRSLRDAGALLAFGSDAPVEPIDPIQGFHAAVTRQDAEGSPEEGWQPSERVDRWTALRAYTRDAAYAAVRENDLGTITPGKRADLVVLSQDIMTVSREQLLDTAVVATYVNGRCVYSRSDWPNT